MRFDCSGLGEDWTKEKEKTLELAWGSKVKPGSRILYYHYPSLYHADRMMAKGKVFCDVEAPDSRIPKEDIEPDDTETKTKQEEKPAAVCSNELHFNHANEPSGGTDNKQMQENDVSKESGTTESREGEDYHLYKTRPYDESLDVAGNQQRQQELPNNVTRGTCDPLLNGENTHGCVCTVRGHIPSTSLDPI